MIFLFRYQRSKSLIVNILQDVIGSQPLSKIRQQNAIRLCTGKEYEDASVTNGASFDTIKLLYTVQDYLQIQDLTRFHRTRSYVS